MTMAFQLAAPLPVSTTKGSDTLESFLSKFALESDLRKKLARIEHVLIVKDFERRKIAKVFMTHVQEFFWKSLSTESNFRKKTF